jgi:hypothetical protein
MYKLACTFVQDFGVWKFKRACTMDEGANDANYITLLQRGEHDENSHAHWHDKGKSNHLKVK